MRISTAAAARLPFYGITSAVIEFVNGLEKHRPDQMW
jgi:hypothetical protein